MKKLPLIMLFMLSCALLPNIQSSDGQPQATQLQRSNPTSTQAQSGGNTFGEVVFRDDFSDDTSGWGSLNIVEGTTGYEGGQYVIRVEQVQIDLSADPGRSFSGGIAVEVTATKLGGDDDNNFGVICRFQDPANYYYFVISSDGYFAAIMVLNNESSFMGTEGWLQSSAINTGFANNAIRAECVGNTFKLFANGSLLLTLQDNTFAEGGVGLIAGTFDVPGTVIAFDDFVVYALD